MPQVTQQHKSLPDAWKIGILVGVFVLAAGAGAGLFLYVRDQDHKVVVQALEQRQSLVLRGKYDEALKLLKEAYPKAHSKPEQLELLYFQGATSLTKGDMAAARGALKEHERLGGLTFEVARQLGYAAARAGDKAEAIEYYNKAINLAEKADLKRPEDEVAELNARIKELQS